MNIKLLDNLLNKTSLGINDAVRELFRLQKGETFPLTTSYDFLNNLTFGGLQKNWIISIAARPSHGKTFFAQTLRKDILQANEKACMLYFNWEMSWFNLLVLEIRKALKKPIDYILKNTPTDSELEEMKVIANEYRNERFTSVDTSLTPDEFEYVCRQYILANNHMDHIVIMVDHIGITKGSNKHEAIYNMMEVCNKLKLDFPNKLTFIILSQLNREIEKLWRTRDTNPINLRVSSEYIFAADSIMQYSDLVIGIVIPQRAGLDKYCQINIEKNEHLISHVVDEDKESMKTYKRLKGDNRVYYDIIKKRLDDGSPSLYCEIINKEEEEVNLNFAQYEKDLTYSKEQQEEDDLDF